MVSSEDSGHDFRLINLSALYIALTVLTGCINYFPIHEVWVRPEVSQPSPLQSVEQILLAAGMEKSPNVIGDSGVLTLSGKVYFISGFRWQRDPKVIVLVRRSEDGKMLQVRLEDGAKGGWAWRPAVFDLAKKIDTDLKEKFSTQGLYIPIDISQHKVEVAR